MKKIIISQKLYFRFIYYIFCTKIKIFYIEKNFLSKIFEKFNLSNLKKINWKIEDIKNKNNQSIYTDIIEGKKVDNFVYQSLEEFQMNIKEDLNFQNYLIKIFSNRSLIGTFTVKDFLVFIFVCNTLFKDDVKFFYLDTSIFNNYIKKNFSNNNCKFKFIGFFNLNLIYMFISMLKKILISFFKKKINNCKQFDIAVLDSYEINKPNIFFSKNLIFKKVLFLTDIKKNLEKKAVYIYDFSNVILIFFVIKVFLENLYKFNTLSLNVLYTIFKFEEKIFYEIFKKYKIKKFLNSYITQEFSSSAVSAIDKLNGVSYGFTCSFSEDYSSQLNIDAYDYFLSFNNCNYTKIKNSKLKKIFYPGYICDYKFSSKKSKAEELRGRLSDNGIKYIIGFFDQGYGPDGMFNFGYHISDIGYQFLLNKILTHEDIGVIIKPKKPKILNLKLSNKSNDLLEKVISSKKCILLNNHAAHHVKNFEDIPAQVAMASDITVHDTLLAGTAALESALVGCKSIMFDYYGAKQSLFNQNNLDIVYTDWNLLWTKIIDDKNKRSNNNFGDWSKIIKKFDPYMDGKANQRIIDILSNE